MRKIAAVVALTTLLVACGGGGGGSGSSDAASSGTRTPTAEGIWQGSTSTGYVAHVAVLENGETWGVYSSGKTVYGALYGQTQWSGSNVTGSGSDFNIPSGSVSSSSYSGSFTEKTNLSITTASGVKFSGNYLTIYDEPASLASVSGSFIGDAVTGKTTTTSILVNVGADGSVSMPGPMCSASGTIRPRSTGKNIFDVAVTFSGTNCALGNGASAAGIAFYNATSKQLVVTALNAAKTDGFIFLATR